MHITPRIENVLIKSKSVLKCRDLRLSDGLVDKNGIKYKTNCAFLDTKVLVQLDVQQKQLFRKVYSHYDDFDFFLKIYCKLVKENCFKILDTPIIIMWAMLKNYIFFLFFSF